MDAELAKRIRDSLEREISTFSKLVGQLIREAADQAQTGTLYGPVLGCSNLLCDIKLVITVKEQREIRLISSPMPDVVLQLTGDTVSMDGIATVTPEQQNDMVSVLICYSFQYAHSHNCSRSSADFTPSPT